MENDLIRRGALMQSLRGNVLVDATPELEKAIEEQPGVGGFGMAGMQVDYLRELAASISHWHDEVCRALEKAADSIEALSVIQGGMGVGQQAADGGDRWKGNMMDRFTRVL